MKNLTDHMSTPTNVDAGSTPQPMNPPLARLHRDQERRWRVFLEQNYPGGLLLRWGTRHRVYRFGERVAKIETLPSVAKDPSQGLAYEFSTLEAIEGRAVRLEPTYRIVDGAWCVLEMDWVEGDYLEDLIHADRAREVSIFRLVGLLFRVSMAGVAYKQLRARHTIRRDDGTLVFIDFGNSTCVGPLIALWRNFVPRVRVNGSWRWGRLASLIREILRRRDAEKVGNGDASSRDLQRYLLNERRTSKERPQHLANHPGDPVAARHFAAMEQCLTDAVKVNSDICADLIKFRFADYGMKGSRDWGLIWDFLARRVDFTGKSVVDLACGMGGVGVFARLDGAARIVSFDSVPLLVDAARHFAEALGFDDNLYSPLDWAKLASGELELPEADIVTALSPRLDDLPREPLLESLSRFPEILWQTSDAEGGRRDLAALGYRVVETLLRADVEKFVLYATDRSN